MNSTLTGGAARPVYQQTLRSDLVAAVTEMTGDDPASRGERSGQSAVRGVATRVYIGGVLPNAPDNVIRWETHAP